MPRFLKQSLANKSLSTTDYRRALLCNACEYLNTVFVCVTFEKKEAKGLINFVHEFSNLNNVHVSCSFPFMLTHPPLNLDMHVPVNLHTLE